MQTILCPHCKKEFEMSQALHDQVLKQVEEDQQEKFEKELEKVKEEERKNRKKTSRRSRCEIERFAK